MPITASSLISVLLTVNGFGLAVLILLRQNAEARCNMDYGLNYDEMIHLDAEELAEQGIGEAYGSLLPTLKQFAKEPAQIEEILDNDLGRYAIRWRGKEYIIYSPEICGSDGQARRTATFVFFTIVNEQLRDSPHRFYAINSDNDLGGMFLTPAEVEVAKSKLPSRRDWPYLPNQEWKPPHWLAPIP